MEQQAFLAGIEHFHRPSCCLGKQGDVCLSCNVFFAAKTAAHQRGDDAHLSGFLSQCCCGLVPVQVWNLAAHIDRGLVVDRGLTPWRFGVANPAEVGRVIAGGYADGAFRFKEQVLGGGCAVGLVNDHIGLLEADFDVTLFHLDVLKKVAVGMVFVQHRRTRPDRLHRVGNRG